eukprot:SAG22_NODE_1229_length_5081_cov_2.651947_4_plen_56_part_00
MLRRQMTFNEFLLAVASVRAAAAGQATPNAVEIPAVCLHLLAEHLLLPLQLSIYV